MSVQDFKELLNAPEFFIFLPTLNYVILFATTDLRWGFVLCVASVVVSSLIYNILNGIPAGNASNVRLGITMLLIGGSIAWIALLVHSNLRLYRAFSQESVIHELLFFTSMVFIAILVMNIILSWYESEYIPFFDNR